MPTAYTSLLGLALPVTGELSGTWGDTVNNYITQYVDAAVAGVQTISGSQTAVTLSVTNGSSLVTAGAGATGSAQFQIINCTGNPAGLLTITTPASSRQYIIINATSTSQSVKIVGTGPTTGVTLVAGEKAHVAWNGSDFVKIATQNGSGDFVTVDTTNLEVTNIKAKDGTASMVLTDSTGAVDISKAVTMSATTQNIALGTSQTSGTFTVGGAAQTGTQTFDQSTKTHTLNLGTGATENTLTKTINLGTAGVSGSTTTITVGSTNGTTTTLNGTVTAATLNSTTIDTTNIEVTNIKAKDGTAAIVLTDSTGAVGISTAVTMSATTQNIALGTSQTTGTFTVGGAAQTGTQTFDQSTKTHTLNIGTGATESAATKTINLGTAGVATSTTAINIGSTNGTTITLNGTVNATTLDLTNIEVTNIKAKDGTASMTLADTTGIITLSATAGTANGVAYLNGSRALTTGSALTFDGTKLGVASGNIDVVSASFVGSPLIAARFNASNFRMGIGIGNSNGFPFLGANVNNAANDNGTFDINGYASRIRLDNGVFQVQTSSVSGTAGNAITWTTPLYLEADGDLGVGTTNPAQRLDVSSASTVDTDLKYNMVVRSTDAYTTTPQAGIAFATTFNTTQNLPLCGIYGGKENATFDDFASKISFGTRSNGGNILERMRLNSSGNLGIGTSSPLARLSVQLPTTSPAGYTAATNSGITLDCGTSTNGVINLVGGGDLGIFHSNSSNAYDVGIGFGNNANRHLTFVTANAERMRLDASGNLGLGITPSAWSSLAGGAFQNGGNGALWSQGTDELYVSQNVFFNGASRYVETRAASAYQQSSGNHRWYTAPSGFGYGTAATSLTSTQNGNSYTIVTAGTTDFTLIGAANNNVGTTFTKSGGTGAGTGTVSQNISFTQAMTLDADGDLGIGATSPNQKLHVENNANSSTWVKVANTNSGAGAAAGVLFTNNGGDLGAISLLSSSNNPADALFLRSLSTNLLVFGTNNTERARITSGGYFKASNAGTYVGSTGAYHELVSSEGSATAAVYIRNTNASSPAGIDLSYSAASPNGTGNVFLYCQDSTALRASIRSNGGLANYQANDVNLSDMRAKKDVVPAPSYWDKIKGIEIVHFKYKDQTHDDNNVGVIAQQVEQVAPEFVDQDGWGETPEDGVPLKSIYTSDMYHAAIKTLQEAMARIEKLEAEVAALKGA